MEPPYSPCDIPTTSLGKVSWFFLLPIRLLFLITIPDIRRKCLHRMYGLTFLMSMVWIGFTAYVLVWMATLLGFTFRIPDAVMGLTFIAFAGSIPDAFASIFVARQGKLDRSYYVKCETFLRPFKQYTLIFIRMHFIRISKMKLTKKLRMSLRIRSSCIFAK